MDPNKNNDTPNIINLFNGYFGDDDMDEIMDFIFGKTPYIINNGYYFNLPSATPGRAPQIPEQNSAC